MIISGAVAATPYTNPNPLSVAKAVAGIFRSAALCHGGILYASNGALAKIGVERHLIPDELNLACDDLVSTGRHPAFKLLRRRATPFDLLTDEELPVEDPVFDRFVSVAHEFGIRSIFIFPLRDSSGAYYAASGFRRERPLLPLEARLIHSYCLDALTALGDLQPSAGDKNLLTRRERECLIAAGGGKTEKDTARMLEISPSTVHAHLESCKRKLRAKNKIEAIVRAIQAGAVAPEDF